MTEEDEYITVTATGLHSDQGTIVVLEGLTLDNQGVLFAVNHHLAQPIVTDLGNGLTPECAVPPWAITGWFQVDDEPPTDPEDAAYERRADK